MQMLVTQKSESRKEKLQMMEDVEIDTAKAIGLCAERNDPERKEAQTNRGVPRGGDMATEIETTVRSKNAWG